MSKKIIITGGLGYIGTELCKIYSGISWNNEILVIDNRFISERVNQLRNWSINFVHEDLRNKEKVKQLDASPRIVFIKGQGAFVIGETFKAVSIAKDLLKTTAQTIYDAEKIGSFKSISMANQFDIEYLSSKCQLIVSYKS